MFEMKEMDLKVLKEKLEVLEQTYSGDGEIVYCSDCGDCEARNSQIYCGNR